MKKDGKWKIVAQITADPETFGPSGRPSRGDSTSDGYYLLKAGKVEDAIQVFSVNVRLRPDSWNAHDSLGEAYAVAGKKELAIEHYEQALKLNPKSREQKAAMAKLKGNDRATLLPARGRHTRLRRLHHGPMIFSSTDRTIATPDASPKAIFTCR